eukprot:CAMPEP_0114563152 /NCGR_PEP_ID=MMETSP0114-20121206/12943_1 /TAXON_ID=31324 /ORGANISM="Goniomonas sp, Strain m" /LENGTH=765 /DNA_ID=CAMNT_0001748951 /DNA_START=10 /DNA_END=2304 /DNA_ORIENTATION=-
MATTGARAAGANRAGRDFRRQWESSGLARERARQFIEHAKLQVQRRALWNQANALKPDHDPHSPSLTRFRAASYAALAQHRARALITPPPLPRVSRLKRAFAKYKSRLPEIYATFENPGKNLLAKILNCVSLLLIALSTIAFVLESLPELAMHGRAWHLIEVIVVSFFSWEYVCRLVTCPNLKDFIFNLLNTVDILAILPFYLELTMGNMVDGLTDLRVLRSIRLFRVFRVFKMSKHSVHFTLLMETLRRSGSALMVLVFIFFVVIIIFAGAIYFLEKGMYDPYEESFVDGHIPPDPFQSIPAACWWAVVTMTTVGYGDARPVTVPGKLIAGLGMLIGILVVALPVTIVGSNFSDVYRSHSSQTEMDSALDCVDEELRQDGFLDLLDQLAAKRQVLVSIFLEVERKVAATRYKGRRLTTRPWTVAEESMLDSVTHNLAKLEDLLMQGALASAPRGHCKGSAESGFLAAMQSRFGLALAPASAPDADTSTEGSVGAPPPQLLSRSSGRPGLPGSRRPSLAPEPSPPASELPPLPKLLFKPLKPPGVPLPGGESCSTSFDQVVVPPSHWENSPVDGAGVGADTGLRSRSGSLHGAGLDPSFSPAGAAGVVNLCDGNLVVKRRMGDTSPRLCVDSSTPRARGPEAERVVWDGSDVMSEVSDSLDHTRCLASLAPTLRPLPDLDAEDSYAVPPSPGHPLKLLPLPDHDVESPRTVRAPPFDHSGGLSLPGAVPALLSRRTGDPAGSTQAGAHPPPHAAGGTGVGAGVAG